MDLIIIQNKIYEIRGERVMLDKDLAELYQVETKVLNRAVKRNIDRFPDRFMFQLTTEEVSRCQIGTLKKEGRGSNIKYLPYAFTEQGVAMLATVLRSSTAILVSINIMDAFVAMRRFLLNATLQNKELEEIKERVKALETGSDETIGAVNDLSEDMRKELDDIYMALAELAKKPAQKEPERPKIGFKK
ncbi:MAG: ORF6N domain-containing protein [Anaerovoracaceae bacterium]